MLHLYISDFVCRAVENAVNIGIEAVVFYHLVLDLAGNHPEIAGNDVLFIHTGGTPLFYDCILNDTDGGKKRN